LVDDFNCKALLIYLTTEEEHHVPSSHSSRISETVPAARSLLYAFPLYVGWIDTRFLSQCIWSEHYNRNHSILQLEEAECSHLSRISETVPAARSLLYALPHNMNVVVYGLFGFE
jgi:hypothetical protein